MKTTKILALFFSITLSFAAQAIEAKKPPLPPPPHITTVTFQVNATRQIQQDEIQASLRFEKTDSKSDGVQIQINSAMKDALELSKKYPDVRTSTGKYFVYKDDQKSQWKGSQTIILESFLQAPMAQLAGELQKNGFVVDSYSYTLSEKSRRSMDDNMRLEIIEKANQIANNVLSKGLGKKFIRFAQIDFTSQNFYPSVSLRAFSGSVGNANSASSPVAQAGVSDVQMTANISAVFEE
ncbi:MAG: SIMPL domain-containing protein [Bdellovibrionota bacterium]